MIPREAPPSIVPRPPPPDWSLESSPTARKPAGPADGWPTSLLTIETSAYKGPLGTPARARPAPAKGAARPDRRIALGCLAAAVALASLALAGWQLYWLVDSTARGRAVLEGLGGFARWLIGLVF